MKHPPSSVLQHCKWKQQTCNNCSGFATTNANMDMRFPTTVQGLFEDCDNFHDGHGANICLLERCHDSYFALLVVCCLPSLNRRVSTFTAYTKIEKQMHTHTPQSHFWAKTPTGTNNVTRFHVCSMERWRGQPWIGTGKKPTKNNF